LGSLIWRTLGLEGASVVVHYNSDSSKAPAEATVQAVKDAGGEAFAFKADLTQVLDVIKLFDETIKRSGRADMP
jgi:NAD(P)-dependent dehydrogenase (short-subunit alcohol dehydrogenase family)